MAELFGLVRKVTQYHFCHNLLVKISHKASPHSRGVDRDPTSPQEHGKNLWSRTWSDSTVPLDNKAQLCGPCPCVAHTISKEQLQRLSHKKNLVT